MIGTSATPARPRPFPLLMGMFLSQCGPAHPAFAGNLELTLASAMSGTRTPAMGALTMRNGRVAEIAVHGLRRNDRAELVRLDDQWLIGSDAKPMVATLVARLVDRGLLSWETPLSTMLPDLASEMRPEYRSVTLRELLSHYSGLPHDVSDLKYFNGFFSDARPLPRQRLDYVVRALKDAPVVPPGTAFSYSNTGFVIAAVIAERAAGMPFEKLMRREVFQPLGMTSAGYGQPGAGEPRGHVGGKPAAMNDGNPLMFAPAGNIHLSLRDWAKFCLDQLDGPTGGGRLLTAASYRLMQTAPAGKEVGLGWGVVDSVAGRKGPALTHAGSDGNWYAVVVLFPTLDDGALVVANAGENMGGDKAARAALKALLPDLAPSQ